VTLQCSSRRRISPLIFASGNVSSAIIGPTAPAWSGISWAVSPHGRRLQTRLGVPVLGLVWNSLGALS
jgi:hypothetical protein